MPSKTSFSDIWQCLWYPQLFHAFRIDCFAKTFNGWLPLNAVVGWLCPTCVTGTWVTSWIDVILIWYYYIVICTLVTIFNRWLSSKDMKLRVLIKKVLVVFHWLTFRVIYIYISIYIVAMYHLEFAYFINFQWMLIFYYIIMIFLLHAYSFRILLKNLLMLILFELTYMLRD